MAVYYPQCFGSLSVVFDDFKTDNTKVVPIEFFPRNATVHLNGYKDADTFEVEIDAASFPFAPEFIRSAAIQLYAFHTTGLIDSQSVQRLDDGSIKREFTQYATDDNLLIAGLVDTASLRYSSDGRAFRVSGRDYTALLIGKTWNPQDRVESGNSLQNTVQKLVDIACNKVVSGFSLNVQYLAEEQIVLGKQGQGLTKKDVTIASPTVGHGHSKTKKKGFPQRSGRTYWDVIYGLCLNHGKIAMIRGTDLIISDPHTLTQEKRDRAVKVTYGINLRSLEYQRNFGKEAVPQIRGSIYSKKERKRITETYDGEKHKPQFAANKQANTHKHETGRQTGTTGTQITGVGTVKETILIVTPPPMITSRTLLKQYLKTFYDNMAQHEGSINFSTVDLNDSQGRNLLLLRAGDPVRIAFDEFKVEDLQNLPDGTRLSRLVALGYSKTVASIIVDNYKRLNELSRAYYTKQVTFSWSLEDGISLEVEAINYIDPSRDDTQNIPTIRAQNKKANTRAT